MGEDRVSGSPPWVQILRFIKEPSRLELLLHFYLLTHPLTPLQCYVQQVLMSLCCSEVTAGPGRLGRKSRWFLPCCCSVTSLVYYCPASLAIPQHLSSHSSLISYSPVSQIFLSAKIFTLCQRPLLLKSSQCAEAQYVISLVILFHFIVNWRTQDMPLLFSPRSSKVFRHTYTQLSAMLAFTF